MVSYTKTVGCICSHHIDISKIVEYENIKNLRGEQSLLSKQLKEQCKGEIQVLRTTKHDCDFANQI